MFISRGLWGSPEGETVRNCPGAPGTRGWDRNSCCGWRVIAEDCDGQVAFCWDLSSPFALLPFTYLVSKRLDKVSLVNFVACLFLLELWRWTLCMHEYIFGLWKGTCWKTFSKNWTECIHAPEKTRARGETHAGRTGLGIFPGTSSCGSLSPGGFSLPTWFLMPFGDGKQEHDPWQKFIDFPPNSTLPSLIFSSSEFLISVNQTWVKWRKKKIK